MGIRVGVSFEGIKRIVDELLYMQPFPLEVPGPSHAKTCPLHPVPSNPVLYSPATPSALHGTPLPIVHR